jgi:hypothetical protein
MSKMSDINIELEDLGYSLVYEAESQADEMMKKYSHEYVTRYLCDNFHMSENTAIMVIAGRKTRDCSTGLLDIDDGFAYFQEDYD